MTKEIETLVQAYATATLDDIYAVVAYASSRDTRDH